MRILECDLENDLEYDIDYHCFSSDDCYVCDMSLNSIFVGFNEDENDLLEDE